MKKHNRFIIFLIICISFICSGNIWGATIRSSVDAGKEFPPRNNTVDLAAEDYERSGLAEYTRTTSLLWSESLKRRNDLEKKLPKVDPALIRKFRNELIDALNQNFDDPAVFILAGQYQLFKGQYESAEWNFVQASRLQPDRADSRMALADYYLSRWQPDQVIFLLRESKDPDSAFRLGEALLQKNDYFSALGYLLQAEPLSGAYTATRNKDIAKVFLSLGETALAKRYLQKSPIAEPESPVREILTQELQGWIAWTEGDTARASEYWTQGKAANPDYFLWDSVLAWIRPSVLASGVLPEDSVFSKKDADLSSQLNITRGLNELRLNRTDSAYSGFLAGIKADRRSLIGFLEAARSRILAKKYQSALNLCNQGLAINSNFPPLLELKLEADTKLDKKDDVAKDNQLLRKAVAQTRFSKKIAGELNQNPYGKPYLLLQGETQNLNGVWISAEGTEWQYQPWWGGPLYLQNMQAQLWVLPIGKGLSGEVVFVKRTTTSTRSGIGRPVFTNDTGFSIGFSSEMEVVAGFFNGEQLGGSYFSGIGTPKHLIPYSDIDRHSQEIVVWYRNSNHRVGVSRWKISVPLPETILEYHLDLETPVTNRREVRLRFVRDGDSSVADKMLISEGDASAPLEWRKFEPEVSLTLSPGDGVKAITAKLADYDGNSTEIKTAVIVDTVSPQVIDTRVIQLGSGNYQLQWNTSKPCNAWLESLSFQGVWQKTPALPNGERSFQGVTPPGISYCRIVLIDPAGNQSKIPITALNGQLSNQQPVKFIVNNGAEYVNSRNVEIKPFQEIPTGWSVSNDLKTWKPYAQANDCRWRVGPGDGEKLIYIKVNGIHGQPRRIIPLDVVVDTIPPSLLNVTVNKLNDGYIIRANFTEPVCPYSIGNREFGNLNYQINHTWEIKTRDFAANGVVTLKVKDQAGNTFEFQPDLSAAGDSITK